MGLIEAIELAQAGGLFAFAWVVYQEVRELRRTLEKHASILSTVDERTRILTEELTP